MTALRIFLRSEAAGGIALMAAALLALVVANSSLAGVYFGTLHHPIAGRTVTHWINDGLMALFFLLVGLEVKQEFLVGHLSSWGRRILPGAAAVAGMVVPALIFIAINAGDADHLRGWAIPAATDIAFALAIVALLGARVPTSLKVLLTAIAVIDDLLAILVIALFYTAEIIAGPLIAAGMGVVLLVALNRMGVRALAPYLLIGFGVWYGVLLSGVHATLAGVAVALTIPLRVAPDAVAAGHGSPLERLEHGLRPVSAFLVLPLFGFANAGIAFAGMDPGIIVTSLPLGIMLGLFLGKQIGIFGTIWTLIRLRPADAPAGASWAQIHGMATLCGIGFTMSLFIGGLAFAQAPHVLDAVKVGVFSGSILAGISGWLLLRRPPKPLGS